MKQTTTNKYLPPLCNAVEICTENICTASNWDVSGVSVDNLDSDNEQDLGNNW